MKKTNKSTGNTSFHNTEIDATPNQLKKIIGDPQHICNDGSDKTNMEWEMETETGEVFTIYDWKEYKPLKPNQTYSFHIGGSSSRVTEKAKEELLNALRK